MNINLIQGDCLEKMKEIEDNFVDSVITDPPYEIGFMGKSWDSTGIANNVELWKECFRVLKPGGHLLAFSGTRTYHRMAVAIEDAGFEVRDMLCWAYGQGFPKSLNVFKQLQKKCKCGNMDIYENRIKQVGNDSQKEAEYFLRFMQEADLSQTISSKKERGEVLQSGLSEQDTHKTMQGEEPKESIENGKEPSVEGRNNLQATEGKLQWSDLSEMSNGVFADGEERWLHNATQISNGSTPKQVINENGSDTPQRPQSEQQQYREPCAFCKQWGTQAIRTHGVGSALKPSIEPICFSRKPLEKGLTIAENCLRWGTGGINIDISRVEIPENDKENYDFNNNGLSRMLRPEGDKLGQFDGGWKIDKTKRETPQGRFPANLLHDNSEEVRECFPETKSVKSERGGNKTTDETNAIRFGSTKLSNYECGFNDSGNASRFFKSVEQVVDLNDFSIYNRSILTNIKQLCGQHLTKKKTDIMLAGVIQEAEKFIQDAELLISGNSTMEKFLMDTAFTIKTLTAQMTELRTLNVLPNWLITKFTEESEKTINLLKELNTEDVKSAKSIFPLQTFISEVLESIRAIAEIVVEQDSNDGERANDNSRFFKSIIYQAKASKSERNMGCEGLEEKQYSHDGREKEIENPYQRNKSVATNNHPTVKPIALMEYLIKMVTPKSGIVLDPFMGSGTTGVACKNLNRNFIGIELDEQYFNIAKKRIEETPNKLTL